MNKQTKRKYCVKKDQTAKKEIDKQTLKRMPLLIKIMLLLCQKIITKYTKARRPLPVSIPKLYYIFCVKR